MSDFYKVIDNFLDKEVAEKISDEFPDYNSKFWVDYNNPIENKKLTPSWQEFLPVSYQTFFSLCSPSFVKQVQEMMGIKTLYPDYGLHGGGYHIHKTGGKLNLHKDYSIHPKLKLRRRLNLIIYLEKDWDPNWGGALEIWTNDTEKNQPKEKYIEVDCIFNRAVIFDTVAPYWHGVPKPINCPDNKFRKSLAIYYLDDPEENTEQRYRALFAPTEDQKNNKEILKFIKNRYELSDKY